MNMRMFAFFSLVGVMLLSIFGSIAVLCLFGSNVINFYWQLWILLMVGLVSYLVIGFIIFMLTAIAEAEYVVRRRKQSSRFEILTPIVIGLFWLPYIIFYSAIDFVVNLFTSQDQKDWERA